MLRTSVLRGHVFFFFRGREKKREGERNGQFSIEGIEEGKLVRSRSFEDK